MARFRHTQPEALLARVVQSVQDDSRTGAYATVLALLSEGPLLTSEALLAAMRERLPPEALQTIWAELQAFLASVVRHRTLGDFASAISVYRPIEISAATTANRVTLAATGDLRDLVVLQLVLLLQEVGLTNLRACLVPPTVAACS